MSEHAQTDRNVPGSRAARGWQVAFFFPVALLWVAWRVWGLSASAPDALLLVAAAALSFGALAYGSRRFADPLQPFAEKTLGRLFRYSELIDRFPAMAYVVRLGEPMTTTYISPYVEKILGYAPVEWIEDPAMWRRILHEDDRDRVLDFLREKNVTGEAFVLEYRVRARDGQVVWIRNNAIYVRDRWGVPRHAWGVMVDVTSQKEAQGTLQAREATYRQVFDLSPEALLLTDEVGAVREANPQLFAMTGWDREEILGVPLAEAPFFAQETRPLIQARLRGRPSDSCEVPFVRKDGTGGYARIMGFQLLPDQGVAERDLTVMIDMTARKRFEETIVRAKNEWERTFDTVPDLIAVLNQHYHVVRINKSFARKLHAEPRDLVGKTGLELVYGSRPPPPESPLVRLMEDGHAHSGELAIERLGGFYSVAVSPILDAEGRFMGAVYVAHDMTEIKKAEDLLLRSRDDLEERVRERMQELARVNVSLQREVEERRLAEKALEQGRATWQSVVEKSPDALIVVDERKVVCYANASAQTLLGLKPAEMIGHPFPFEVTVGAVQEIALSPVPRQGKSGEMRIVMTEWAGRPAYLVSIRDITGRVELEAQLRQALKMDAIGRLAGGIAHDFNNLLTSILGFGRLALDSVDPKQTVHSDLQEVLKAGERAAKLTSQLLAFGRKQVMQMVPLDLNEILLNMDKLLRRTLGEDIELVTVPGEHLLAIEGDRSSIEQIILNLVVNARDAMPHGGKIVLMTDNCDKNHASRRRPVGLERRDYVLLTIRDTGSGIPEAIRERIFEPFFTTKDKGKGTGLGLSMVYGIVKQLQGEIVVESEEGRGTEFSIYFPGNAEYRNVYRIEATVDQLPRGTETILVVEDEDTVRHLTCRMLKDLGYTTMEARNGIDGLQAAREYGDRIDLVLSDVVMPQMSGVDMVAQIRKIRSDFKVLYSSGFTGDKLIDREGEEDPLLLLKPFSREKLAQMVRKALDRELVENPAVQEGEPV